MVLLKCNAFPAFQRTSAMEQNPLEITATGVKSTINKRGRPVNAETIQFSRPQPKSAIISQILRQKSLEQSLESTSCQIFQNTDIDDDFPSAEEDEMKEIEIKLEVICNTNSKRPKTKTKTVKKPKKHFKEPKDKQEKRFACDYPNCTYAAKLSCNLVKHKRRHTSEKPYICDQCPFRTNFINSLKVHRRIHTAEKPYNCEHCGYRCNTSSNLKKHRMHRHPEVAKI